MLSPSNTERRIGKKGHAVVAEGAIEFWECDRQGKLQCFGPRGRLGKSRFCSQFPKIGD